MKKQIKIIKITLLFVFLSLVASGLFARATFNNNENLLLQEKKTMFFNSTDSCFRVTLGGEYGLIGFLSHKIQQDTNGSQIDYLSEGGQNILYPFIRVTTEFNFAKNHNIVLLYQPFEVSTFATLRRDLVVNGLTFPNGTGVNFFYGFSFYRISYMYDFFQEEDVELSFGLSIQLRNASISFKSTDGTLFRTNNDLGVVPIIKIRTRFPISKQFWIGGEVDGFWASGKYITISENDFEGLIVDLSFRIGMQFNNGLDLFLNVRYLGGGARGTDRFYVAPGDGFVDNWIHTLSISIGTYIK